MISARSDTALSVVSMLFRYNLELLSMLFKQNVAITDREEEREGEEVRKAQLEEGFQILLQTFCVWS